jgi:predicted esterase
LHGYGQLATDFGQALLPLLGTGTRLVVPEGLSRFYLRSGGGAVGASWMTRHGRDEEIADYLAYLDAVHAVETQGRDLPVHVLGFSQGAATAARWAVHGATTVRTLILWGGDVPPDLDREAASRRLADTRILLVNGTADPYVPRERVQSDARALTQIGLQPELVWFEGGHHLSSTILDRFARDL